MNKRVRSGRVACVALAGACLLAPGLAVAGEAGSGLGILASVADGARDAGAAQAYAEAAPDGTDAASADPGFAPVTGEPASAPQDQAAPQTAGVTVFAGVQFALPADYTVTEFPEMLLAMNADATVAVTALAPGAAGEGILDGEDDLLGFFGELAAEAASSTDTLVVNQGVVELADGAPAYAFTIEAGTGGDAVVLQQFYVPVEGASFVLVQFSYEVGVSDEAIEEVLGIADTLALAQTDASAELSDVEVPLGDVTAGGIAFTVPDALIYDATQSTDDEPVWVNESGDFMFGVIPHLVDAADAALLTSADYAQLYADVAASLGGEAQEPTDVQVGGASMKLGVFVYEDVDGPYVGALGLVEVADGSLTGVMAVMAAGQLDAYGAMLDDLFESVRVV